MVPDVCPALSGDHAGQTTATSRKLMADRSDIIPNTWHFIPTRENQAVRWRWQRRNSRHEVLAQSEAFFGAFDACVEDARRNGYMEPHIRQ